MVTHCKGQSVGRRLQETVAALPWASYSKRALSPHVHEGLQGSSLAAEPPRRAITHSYPGGRQGRPEEAAKQTSSGQNQPQTFSVPPSPHPSQCQTVYANTAVSVDEENVCLWALLLSLEGVTADW